MSVQMLNGQWEFGKVGDRERLPARVPGDVYADLLNAKRIPDPFYRDNEDRLQWIGHTDWQYSRSFDLAPALLVAESVVLRCDGLDTLAEVTVNGQLAGRADNMFRTWEWDVKPLLKRGRNTIRITFASTETFIAARNRELARQDIAPMRQALVRKEQCNYGWDWGIKAVTCGIWRDIALVGRSVARLCDVAVRQVHRADGAVMLKLAVAVESSGAAGLTVQADIALDGSPVASGSAAVPAGVPAELECLVERPLLWWPVNMGGQPLYTASVRLLATDGTVIDQWERRIGLRELVLDRHADQWGESFQFVINGVPFFAKGANWIPNDAIQARMTPARYRERVAATAAANMNMLRVWGGGLYEDDAFYEACDELGVCVWQDFMFSCAAYPLFDQAFLDNVQAEADDNVRRLRHHACLALWCGNNELEQGYASDAGWAAGKMPWPDYKRLFDEQLAATVARLDPDRPYWPSSPHSPYGDRNDHSNAECGDAHLWAVWHGRQPFEWYRTCTHRFNSEFGFQSFPEPRTVAGYTVEEDRNITSYIMEHHQRSGIGNTTIMQYMLDWFRLPDSFAHTLWASQILQGMAMKYACEHWRRSMPRGMGTLIWQLNDTWPVASWSSIDYHGRWKALHYMARHFFAPVMISGLEDTGKGTVAIHGTNDLRQAVAGEAVWTVTDLAGEVLDAGRMRVRLAAGSSRCLRTLRLARLIKAHGPRNLLVWLKLTVDGQPESTNLVHFARPKHLELHRRPGLRAGVRRVGRSGVFRVRLQTRRPVLWAWLSLRGYDAVCSDNFVHLRPGESVTIEVTPEKPLALESFRESLEVQSLVDTY